MEDNGGVDGGCGELYAITTDPPKKKMTIIIINCISYSMPSTI